MNSFTISGSRSSFLLFGDDISFALAPGPAVKVAAFLGASICIRALRFTLVTGATHVAAFLLRNVVSTPKLYLIHAASWIIFYVFYFTKFGF